MRKQQFLSQLSRTRRFGVAFAACLFLAAVPSVQAAPSQSVPPLTTVAPDATAFGPFAITDAEYKFEATIDPQIIPKRYTELWAVVHRPLDLSTPRPLVVLLHGNHGTCGTGSNPRIDNRSDYTDTGTCPEGYVVVPSHRGYDYIAQRLASWGYIVVSINANRGINSAQGIPGDQGLNLTRGRLILKHLERLSEWNTSGGTPASLGVDLKGKIDFNHLGLMGHSRGGEGMRAAYNLYFDPGSAWPGRIPDTLHFEGLFEFAPVDGQTYRTLNAGGLPWNVVLPECDGDVSNLDGIKPFDRMQFLADEYPARPKSAFIVWGANHNYFNTEWQTSDSLGCLGHTPIFEPGLSVGSPSEQETGLASLMAFVRGYIGTVADPTFTQIFNPQFAVPDAVTAVTRIERGFTDSANATVTRIIEDFDQPTGTSSAGLANTIANVIVSNDKVKEHDEILRAGQIAWTRTGENVFFQANAARLGEGIDLSPYKTLELRLENRLPSTQPTDFSLALVLADGRLSSPVPLSKYLDLVGPVGGPGGIHTMLQSLRIPLADFAAGTSVGLRGLRLTFNGTGPGAIVVANIRLTTVDALVNQSTPPTQKARLTATAPLLAQANVITGNTIVALRRVSESPAEPGIEIEVSSQEAFPIRNELAVLRIGEREFLLSRYLGGDSHRLVFTLSEAEFAQIASGEEISVQYGRGNPTGRRWRFGTLNKDLLR